MSRSAGAALSGDKRGGEHSGPARPRKGRLTVENTGETPVFLGGVDRFVRKQPPAYWPVVASIESGRA